MAILLHRLGRWCARHRWTAVGAWIALLALTVAGALTFMKPLTNDISIPDSRFENVLNTLREEIPAASGTTGTVVFTSEQPFTAEQEQAISGVIDRWNAMDDVEAIDPFESQDQLDGTFGDLADARKQLEDGRAEIDKGETDLADARTQLEDGRAQLEDGEA